MAAVELQSLMPRGAALDEEAVEIGSVPRMQRTTAMWLSTRSADDAALVYKREVGPLSIGLAPREATSGDVLHRWWRLEVKIHQDVVSANRDLWLDNARMPDCVLAIHPYSVCWAGASPLKPSSHREQPELPAGLDSFEQLSAHLEGFPHDYWETGNYLTASFDTLPSLLDDDSNIPVKSMIAIGICQSAEDHNTLMNTDRVATLLRLTEQGQIRFVMKGVPNVPLHPEVCVERYAYMHTAIQQALAGPVEQSPTWVDREVVEKVERIYKLHLNNHNRVLHRKSEEADYESMMNAADTRTPETVTRSTEIVIALRRLASGHALVTRLLDAFAGGAVTKEDVINTAGLTEDEYHHARRQLKRLVAQLRESSP